MLSEANLCARNMIHTLQYMMAYFEDMPDDMNMNMRLFYLEDGN